MFSLNDFLKVWCDYVELSAVVDVRFSDEARTVLQVLRMKLNKRRIRDAPTVWGNYFQFRKGFENDSLIIEKEKKKKHGACSAADTRR